MGSNNEIIHTPKSKIIIPNRGHYLFLKMEPPEDLTNLVAPTREDLVRYGKVDPTYGIPLRTRSFFGSRDTELFAPRDEDYSRLGIEKTLIVQESPLRVDCSSYSVEEDGVAYTSQKTDVLIDGLAQLSKRKITSEGFAHLKLLQHGLNLVIYDPKILKLKGTKWGSKLYPYLDVLDSVLNSGRKFLEGETTQGFKYRVSA